MCLGNINITSVNNQNWNSERSTFENSQININSNVENGDLNIRDIPAGSQFALTATQLASQSPVAPVPKSNLNQTMNSSTQVCFI